MKKSSTLRQKGLSFTIAPETTSEHPYRLQFGKRVVFNIRVENRSETADLVFLKCPELPAEWYTIEYVAVTVAESVGVVQLTEKLSLHPQEVGEIKLTLHPPIDAVVGNYFPTLQLVSMSAPDLAMLDVIYVQLLPDTHLDTRITPDSRMIPSQPGTFSFMVRNRGNVSRILKLEVKDAGQLFRFETDLPNNIIRIAPGQETTIELKAFPRNRWKRPLKGAALRSNMAVNLIAADDLTASHSTQAKLIWLPQPKWVLGVLLVLGAGTCLSGLGVLYRFNRPAIAAPEILSFTATHQDDVVKLNWKVNNPENLSRIVVAQLNDGAESQTVRYDFSASIPHSLKATDIDQGCRENKKPTSQSVTFWQLPLPNLPWFSSLQQFPTPTTIECRNIAFNTTQAGTFRYKLRLLSEDQTPIAEETSNAIALKSIPELAAPPVGSSVGSSADSVSQPPQILAFTVNGQSQSVQSYSVREGERAEIAIAWSVQNSVEVLLSPGSGSVAPRGAVNYSLRSGESRTITLTARNATGESVTQSIEVSAIGVNQPNRSPFRAAPVVPVQPSPQPSSVEPAPPETEGRQKEPSQESSPTPTPEGSTPEALPTASP